MLFEWVWKIYTEWTIERARAQQHKHSQIRVRARSFACLLASCFCLICVKSVYWVFYMFILCSHITYLTGSIHCLDCEWSRTLAPVLEHQQPNVWAGVFEWLCICISYKSTVCMECTYMFDCVWIFFFNRSDSLLNSTSQRHANARATASVNRLMDFVETPTFAIPAVYLYSVKKKATNVYIYIHFQWFCCSFFFFNKTLFSLVAFFFSTCFDFMFIYHSQYCVRM